MSRPQAGVSDTAALFAGAMPKGIGVPEFLKEHPEYDGRGVIIAILDTGVDPGAAGLQLTSDGKPKILDILDCTGSGDIDTSTIAAAEAGSVIAGFFGRKLTVNEEWVNPKGEWRVGYKRAFDIFAGGLKKRITDARRRRLDAAQRDAVTAATKDLAAAKSRLDAAASVSEADKKNHDEMEARVSLLKELIEGYKDPGPLLHAVVWHDGERWLAALEVDETGAGALADAPALADFSLDRRFGTFSAEDACNYGVHVYNEGDLLSVVVECGSHGTHVAGIAAAYHPDEPELNGIAPGAQIVSMKIGDSRLSGMETNVGLTRALIDVLRHKADLMNLSYGESTATPDAGRFIELANEVVNEHGVIFVSSAGNSGPALSTVGAPGGTSSAIIGVGAYVSPELAAAGHSVRESLEQGQQYTWSSRGPAADGYRGVSISAPGGAVAPVPQWTRQARQLMNGTSMASPCACGGFALLLSGLKALGQQVTPARLRRAVENTCEPVFEDVSAWPLTYGRGLMQVDAAFDLLQKSEEADSPDVRYEVKVRRSESSVSQRGVYLREPRDVAGPSAHVVEVLPRMKEDADPKEQCLKVEDKILLKTTAKWADCPQVLLLPFNGRSFELKVDPASLAPGAHYAEVLGLDSTREWRGPLFRVPITVIKPVLPAVPANGHSGHHQPACYDFDLGSLEFSPGQEVRRFLDVPEGARWGELRLTAGSYDTPKMFLLRAAQLLPHTRFSDTEARTSASLPGGSELSMPFRATGGATLEITIAQFWSSLGAASVRAQVSFHGIEVPRTLQLDGATGVAKFYIRAPFRREKVAPTAKLHAVHIPLRPTSAVLEPLTAPRDALPRNRTIHRLELTYKLKVEEPGAYKPTIPMLNRYMYDSVVEAEMYMIYDANKRLLSTGDVYPAEVTLQKGDHAIKLLLRHDDTGLLDKLRDAPLVVERKLKDPIPVPVYHSNSDAVLGKTAVKDFVLCAGERRALFLGPLTADDKLPKDAEPGRLLVGKLQLGKLSELAGGKEAPATSVIKFLVPPKKDAKEPRTVADEAEDATADPAAKTKDQHAAKLLEATVKFLEDSRDPASDAQAEQLDAIAARALEDSPGHLPVLLWRLKRAEAAYKKAAKDGTGSPDAAPVTEAADDVLAAVDRDAVARHAALKNPEEGPGAEKRKQAAEEQRSALVAALHARARLLVERAFAEPGSDSAAISEAVAAFGELRKWVDTTDAQYAVLHAKKEAAQGQLALAIKALQKVACPTDKAPDRAALELRIELLGRLGWEHWKAAEQSRMVDAFPPNYRPF